METNIIDIPNVDNPDKSTDQTVTVISDDSDEVVLESELSVSKNGSTSSSLEADSGGDISANSASGNKQIDWMDRSSLTYDETLCSVCNINRVDYNCGLDKSEINYMLKFVLHRIRAWLPNTITHTMAQEDRPEWLTDSELTWRANQFFFEHRDMSVIEVKLNTESYSMFSEFLADIYTVQHNVAIFHGIWAKQKGYPYWPAKVMKETATHYDVRFFGGKYERALLVKSLVKPITVSKESLQIRTSAAFNKSYEELKFHQLLLSDPLELEKLKAMSKPRRRTVSKQKNSLLNTSANNTPKSKNSKASSSIQSADVTFEDVVSVVAKPSGKRKSNNYTESHESKDKKKKVVEEEHNSSQAISGNVIDISDGEEEECTEYSFRENNASQESFGSTENFGKQISPRRESGMQPLDQPYSDSVEKMRRKLECLSNKKRDYQVCHGLYASGN
ncbi:hypothetical protein NQ314_003950 [Rhamnusium bicolor]|uniref:PWWP domain-containing protein n=1 Tax=Rhamnusium bicolor TaxID=1586634 RepID=A0AAV8ZML0_9CUCU|nr:hypothetical protein NQ314_003950 [Rhamnusium bicolor]